MSSEVHPRVHDVLMQGSPFCDLTFVFSDLEALPPLGREVFARDFAANPGGCFNVMAALVRLGVPSGLIAQLGTDIFSRFIAERMENAGLPLDMITWVDRPLPIVTVGVSLPHDRLFLSYAAPDRGDSPRLTVDHLDALHPRVIMTLGEIGVNLCREARDRGILVVLDTFWNPEYLRSEDLRDLMHHVDIFTPNLLEALEITGRESVQGALETLSDRCDCVIIKCGSDGALMCHHGQEFAIPSIPVRSVDTTGAGDNFNAGLIYGLLQGYSMEKAVRCAIIAGGLSTMILGGSGNTATAEELETLLRSSDGG